MSQAYSNADDFDPEAGSPPPPSPAQAAADLARDVIHTAAAQASALKDKAVESAQQFKETATEKAQQFKSVAAEKAETLKNAAAEKARQVRESASEQWNETRLRSKDLHTAAEGYVRDNPTKSVLGAIGVGFVIGLILRR